MAAVPRETKWGKEWVTFAAGRGREVAPHPLVIWANAWARLDRTPDTARGNRTGT